MSHSLTNRMRTPRTANARATSDSLSLTNRTSPGVDRTARATSDSTRSDEWVAAATQPKARAVLQSSTCLRRSRSGPPSPIRALFSRTALTAHSAPESQLPNLTPHSNWDPFQPPPSPQVLDLCLSPTFTPLPLRVSAAPPYPDHAQRRVAGIAYPPRPRTQTKSALMPHALMSPPVCV